MDTGVGNGRQGLAANGQPVEAMRRANESAVLRAVFAHGPVSRADVVRLTGLSAPSVTKVTWKLIDAGLLRGLSPELRTDIGRPRVPLAVDAARVAVLGVHIGKANTVLALVGLDGSIGARDQLLHRKIEPATLADRLSARVDALLAAHLGGRRLAGTGVIIGGWVDEEAGVVVRHPALGWNDVPLLDLVGDRLPGPVRLEEHVRAIARAEMWYGVGREVDDFVMVHVGNVFDAAIVVNRVIHRGPRGAAGGIEHLRVTDDPGAACECGLTGCLAAVATDSALNQKGLAEQILKPGEGLRELSALARSGNSVADQILRQRARHVGRAVATIVDVVNPARVVLGRGLAGGHDTEAYLDDLRAEASKYVHRAAGIADRIVASRLGAEPFVVAAAAPVLEGVLADPLGFASVPR